MRLASDDDPEFYRARNRLSELVYESSLTEPDRAIVIDWLKELKGRAKALDDAWVMGQVIAGPRPISPGEGLELVFNGHLFHRVYAKERKLTEMRGWQWTLIGQLLFQIEALSKIYWELAEALGVVFANSTLLPNGFEPALTTEVSGNGGSDV